MRNISLIFAAAALVLATPSVAGSSQEFRQGNLPGIGSFSYSGSPVAVTAPALIVAGLTKAERS